MTSGVCGRRSPVSLKAPSQPSAGPAAWNRLRLVVRTGRVQVFLSQAAATPALDVRELQPASSGLVGLYVDNGSDGVFANLRIVPSN